MHGFRLFGSKFLINRCSYKTNFIRTVIQVTADSAKQEVHEVTIPVPWGYVAGRWWGDKKKQPIVALHGVEDNAASFDLLIPLLQTNGVPVFAIDIPGHGRSDHLPYGVPPHYCDLIVFLRNLLKCHYSDWKNLTLLGHSFGSSACLAYAGIYPEDVERLICIECCSLAMSSNNPVKIKNTLEKTLKYEKMSMDPPAYTYEELVVRLHKGRKERLSLDACKTLLTRGMTVSKTNKDKFHLSRDISMKLTALGQFSLEYWNKLASRVKANVLVIEGTLGLYKKSGAREMYLSHLDLMAKSATKLEHAIVEGGHHVHLDDPIKVAPIINSFLASKLQ